MFLLGERVEEEGGIIQNTQIILPFYFAHWTDITTVRKIDRFPS